MLKKRKIEEEENQDRWVVSYADFITLLFAFFTTMYAISHVDLGKLERFSGSMQSAFKTPHEGDVGKGTIINGIRPIRIGLPRAFALSMKAMARPAWLPWSMAQDGGRAFTAIYPRAWGASRPAIRARGR